MLYMGDKTIKWPRAASQDTRQLGEENIGVCMHSGTMVYGLSLSLIDSVEGVYGDCLGCFDCLHCMVTLAHICGHQGEKKWSTFIVSGIQYSNPRINKRTRLRRLNVLGSTKHPVNILCTVK